VIPNQGLQGISFFEATACLTLLVLFIHLKRDNATAFYKLWLFGWISLTLSSFSELALTFTPNSALQIAAVGAGVAAFSLFLASILQLTLGENRLYIPMLWLAGVLTLITCSYQRGRLHHPEAAWEVSILSSVLCLASAWLLWRAPAVSRGHGAKLLAGAFTLLGLNNIDRPQWTVEELHLIRFAFDHFLNASLGIGMIVLLLEAARVRTVELSEKMRQFTMLTASSSQTVSLPELLQKVLHQILGSLNTGNGLIRLLEGKGEASEFVIRASLGFSDEFRKQNDRLSLQNPWIQEALKENYRVTRFDEERDLKIRRSMAEAGLSQVVSVPMRGKASVVGMLHIGARAGKRFHDDELAYLVNVANFLGTTVENVSLFEQVKTVQQQWVYTFDSIGDPILVHDKEGRIVRTNLRLANLLGKDCTALVGRSVTDFFSPREASFQICPYCEEISGEADQPDPWLQGFFLASNSIFTDPAGRKLGTIHVLKDITERKRAEEKYRTLVASVQEGVFITTVQGRFLDFNDAFMRITGYADRDELMQTEIPQALYVNSQDRDRLKRLLQEHGSVNDFEFEIRRKDGEIRTVSESSTAIRDSTGNVTAYQGFLLDVSERRRAEQEIRRRNRELVVLNSIAETLASSLDLSDSVQRTLRQILELFGLDSASLYLLDPDGSTLRRITSVGLKSEYARTFSVVTISPEFLQQVRAVRATFLSANGLPLPPAVRELQKKEGIESAFLVVLWSKDKMIGGLAVGSRSQREFSAADSSLMIAVGSQVANAVERSQLYAEARQAYENLRRAQEQLLHSEKLAAVGQLISGVAHELNNPLTAILGYSQLLTSNGQLGAQALAYTEKLYKQAQRTHRIVQNLLSFSRQHKPERSPVRLKQIIEDTLGLRDYDLRMSQIDLQLDLAEKLPEVSADPHQLQQVFLNLINNAVDAILEQGSAGKIRVHTGVEGDQVFIEFSDSGPGVKDPSRVFDPFYTTKPVGKGTGLGLSICYGIITEHGGTIRVQNLPQGGACFRIELPLQPNGAKSHAAPASRVIAPRGGRILVVDSHESVLDAVAGILRKNDYAVETSKSLSDARRLFVLQDFDLVVADWRLVAEEHKWTSSDTNGKDALGLGSRILWMSTISPDNQGRLTLPVPSGGVLQKPFRAEDLLAAVESKLPAVVSPAAP
jgi:PAS domain S-box-containing protein